MSKEQQYFLKALEANEDDEATRLVYADWLEENGFDEEAQRQRKWPEAKLWMLEFTRSINHNNQDEDPHTYEYVMEQGHSIVNGENAHFGTDAGADYFREGLHNKKEFFKYWSILTGEPVPSDQLLEDTWVRCAC